MGQTRVDLQHLLEDLRDAYPDAIEETILSEVVANALDSGAASVHVLTEPSEKTVAVEPAGTQAFLTTFLARWGEAVGRDRRRRQPRARAGR
jgi:hypothetical protein